MNMAVLALRAPAKTTVRRAGQRRSISSLERRVGRRVEVMRVGRDGSRVEMDLHLLEILQTTHLHARDLALVGSRKQAIYPVPGCVVCNLSHMNVLIQHDGAVVFEPRRPSVNSFLQDLDQRMKIRQAEEGENEKTSFELLLLENILDTVSEKYERRLRCYSTVTRELLAELQAKNPSEETLHRLLPISNQLDSFERANNRLLDSLIMLLKSDEDMVRMHLTRQIAHGDDPLPLEMHEDVELLLERYARAFTDTGEEIRHLRSAIRLTQTTLRINLDAYRNRLMMLNLKVSMAAMGIGCSTAIAGFFGMNLTSGLEEAFPQVLFWSVCGGSMLIGAGVYGGTALQLHGDARVQKSNHLDYSHRVRLRYEHLGDMQDVLLGALDRKEREARELSRSAQEDFSDFAEGWPSVDAGANDSSAPETRISRDEFKEILQDAAPDMVVLEEDVEATFAIFDHDDDGYLDRTDIFNLVCHNSEIGQSL